ncbi:MAG: type IX secretion system sortase PorU [Bacteroidota bacterium]
MRNGIFLLIPLLMTMSMARAQRSYKNASVLASGNWYQIAVNEPGVYKVDLGLLNKLGINTTNLSSSAIRLFGNGGAMLPEACNGFKNDDLVENAIRVVDGGDGVFNGSDYFLFFANGPDTWLTDSVNQRFKHQKNLYGNRAIYFISIGGTGERIQEQQSMAPANATVVSFSGRYFHELDSVNVLSSGKDWYGEELSAQAGHATSKSFSVPLANTNTTRQATLVSNCVARSVGGSSRFTVSMNGQSVLQQDIDPVGSGNLDLFAKSLQSAGSFTVADNPVLTYRFAPGGMNAEGWIDWFEIFYRRNLALVGSEQLLFRDWNSVAAGNIASFRIQQGATAQVWDITTETAPMEMHTTVSGTELSFVNDAATLHEYIAFSTGFLNPVAIGKIGNQNLHNTGPADMIIVTHPSLLQQALAIASFHQQKDNLKTVTVTTNQVFNEFSSGLEDPAAIRDFTKMYYDKAAGDSTKRPRYLLLLGDASFDYKNRLKNNSNLVPAYENGLSLDPLSTYTSDDFFGFLDDTDDINAVQATNLLDIGIGRIPAKTPSQAQAYVDKLYSYTNPKSLGAWRNQQTFIADDQDQNLHFSDAELITAAAAAANPLFIQDKIYLDAYTQVSTPAGSRYPDVNQAINDEVQNGTLIWNYNGHGSNTRLAEEVVLEKNIVDTWNNEYRLPLFITATCDFAPFDNPAINSLGENILLREKTGAIALMTTTRLVFAFSNRIMNRNYLQIALQPRPDGTYLSLGDAVKQAKNFTYQTQADFTNNRKFTLLGDPALTLAYPRYRVETLSINDKAITSLPDTLKALQQYTVKGQVRDGAGAAQTGFNGTLYATVVDKIQTVFTLGNDPDSYKAAFQVQRNALFKGNVKVVNGGFSLRFVVPKDIHYQPGNGRINYYVENGEQDGNGNFTGFLIGGSAAPAIVDQDGPSVKAYLNDENFVNGSVVNPAPLLLVNLRDSSGINIMGTGIGHDISAVLDGDTKQTFILNDFYEAGPDNYRQGMVRFQLPPIDEGSHTLVIKAWDAANNSNETTIRFRVLKDRFLIAGLMNYPNPFIGHTSFRFEHNRPYVVLKVDIGIFTPFGKRVKTITTTINSAGSRSSDIDWEGTGEGGEMLARGIYIYRLQVSTSTGETAVQSAKLVRL